MEPLNYAKSKETESLGEHDCRQKCLDKSLFIYLVYFVVKYSLLPEPLETAANIPVTTMKLTKTIRNPILKYGDKIFNLTVFCFQSVEKECIGNE